MKTKLNEVLVHGALADGSSWSKVIPCFDDKNRSAEWRIKPSWYIVVDKDSMIPPAVQRDSAARVNANRVNLAPSHVPMLSRPEEVARVIEGAVAKLAAKSLKAA